MKGKLMLLGLLTLGAVSFVRADEPNNQNIDNQEVSQELSSVETSSTEKCCSHEERKEDGSCSSCNQR